MYIKEISFFERILLVLKLLFFFIVASIFLVLLCIQSIIFLPFIEIHYRLFRKREELHKEKKLLKKFKKMEEEEKFEDYLNYLFSYFNFHPEDFIALEEKYDLKNELFRKTKENSEENYDQLRKYVKLRLADQEKEL